MIIYIIGVIASFCILFPMGCEMEKTKDPKYKPSIIDYMQVFGFSLLSWFMVILIFAGYSDFAKKIEEEKKKRK